jgi:hypothetical protein
MLHPHVPSSLPFVAFVKQDDLPGQYTKADSHLSPCSTTIAMGAAVVGGEIGGLTTGLGGDAGAFVPTGGAITCGAGVTPIGQTSVRPTRTTRPSIPMGKGW